MEYFQFHIFVTVSFWMIYTLVDVALVVGLDHIVTTYTQYFMEIKSLDFLSSLKIIIVLIGEGTAPTLSSIPIITIITIGMYMVVVDDDVTIIIKILFLFCRVFLCKKTNLVKNHEMDESMFKCLLHIIG